MRRIDLVLLWLCLCLASVPAFAGGFSLRYTSTSGWDGTPLGAVVISPKDQDSGPFPLIMMPSSWALPSLEYVGRGTVLASQGDIVNSRCRSSTPEA